MYLGLEDLHTKVTSTETKSLDEFSSWFYSCYPALKQAEKVAYDLLFTKLKEAEVGPATLEQITSLLAQRAQAAAIAKTAWEVSEGQRPETELAEIIKNGPQMGLGLSDQNVYKFVTTRIKELRLATVQKAGLRWPLRCLNRSLGSLRKGDFGFTFARPETGKTTFFAHTAAHMAPQCKTLGLGPVTWINWEEQGEKVNNRVLQAVFGITLTELYAREDYYQEKFDQTIGDSGFNLYDSATATRKDVEAIVEQTKPGLLILDQIDKVRGFEADRPDLVFGKIYQWARELCKEFCPVIGTCQASGDAEGVRWLYMDHVAEAKTAKQAEADWIIGIGKSNEEGTETVRYLNICKNKLVGDEDSDTAMRHGRFNVFIRPSIARYEEIELDD